MITHILLPQSDFTNFTSSETLFYLRHLIARDKKINVAHVILRHMHHASESSHAPLPYGHLVEEYMISLGIPLPEKLWGKPISGCDRSYPRNLIGDLTSLGWTEGSNGKLIPDPNHVVNDYILTLGAAPNQYGPPREGSPPSDAESSTDGPKVSLSHLDKRFDDIYAHLGTVEKKIDRILTALGPQVVNASRVVSPSRTVTVCQGVRGIDLTQGVGSDEEVDTTIRL